MLEEETKTRLSFLDENTAALLSKELQRPNMLLGLVLMIAIRLFLSTLYT